MSGNAAPVGARLERGAPLGTVADAPAHCAVPCVHWGVRLDDDYVHPLPFVGAQRPSVLLPLP